MIILGYAMAVLIGVSLGLIGSGGSILALPILVYLFGVSPMLATTYSLFVVGISALFALFSYMKNKLLNYRTSLVFGIPSLTGVLVSRKLLLPNIPKEFFTVGNIHLTKDIGIMIFFALLMIAASFSMIKKEKLVIKDKLKVRPYPYSLIILEGLLVGVVTGLVGAGGGFLIIPVLIFFTDETMKNAIGTSLLVITLNSIIGFSGDLSNHTEINWSFLLFFSSFALAGIVIGTYLTRHISGAKLKPLFGWIILVMGIFIIAERSFKL
jgi:uncharacterized membrane protein YfcA